MGSSPRCGSLGPLAALWSFLTFCACLEEKCILGIVGQPVSLPCVQPQITASANVTIEWRRGEEVVLRSAWRADGVVEEWSVDGVATPPHAALTGDVSLQLPRVDAAQRSVRYRLLVTSRDNRSAELCSVCLLTAASFSSPLLSREAAPLPGGETAFWCHSSGGFPEPAVFWLVDGSVYHDGSVSTLAAQLPDSQLYNVSSRLTLKVSGDASVACVVQNPSSNEALTSTNSGVKVTAGPVVTSRASDAMWIFSTVLCCVVGVMVLVGVVYQVHLDRMSRRKKHQFQKQMNRGGRQGNKSRLEEEEEEEEKLEEEEEELETDV